MYDSKVTGKGLHKVRLMRKWYISALTTSTKVDERTCSVATMARRHVPWPNATTASQSLAVGGGNCDTHHSHPRTTNCGHAIKDSQLPTLYFQWWCYWRVGRGGIRAIHRAGALYFSQVWVATDCNQLLSEVFEWASESKEDNKMKK